MGVIAALSLAPPVSAEPRTVVVPPHARLGKKATKLPPPRNRGPHFALGGEPPAPFKIFGVEFQPILHGAVQVDVMHDFNALGPAASPFVNDFITSEIPPSGTLAARQTGRTGFSANQSVLYAGFRGDTEFGRATVFTQTNFERFTTGPPVFDLYLGWFQLGRFRAGLAWTTFTNVHAIPETLDFEGPNGIPEVQHVMLRYSQPLLKHLLDADLALEQPEPDPMLPSGSEHGSGPVGQVPDVLLRLQLTPGATNIQLTGLYRRIGASGIAQRGGERIPYESAVNTWAGSLSGELAFSRHDGSGTSEVAKVIGRDAIQFGIVYGTGLGNYIQDTLGLHLDAAPPSPGATTLVGIEMLGSWGGLQVWYADGFRSTFCFGYAQAYLTDAQPGSTYDHALYVSGNLLWNPIAPWEIGLEYMYGNRVNKDGTSGHNSRVQLSNVFRSSVF